MSYTGVKVIHVSQEKINEIYETGVTSSHVPATEDQPEVTLYPNMFVVLKAPLSGSALTKVSKDTSNFELIKDNLKPFGLTPRNKEQTMMINTLADNDVPLSIVLGKAGTGKTICASAVALHKLVETREFDKVVFSKPMVTVGRPIGAVPGDVREKFGPYLYSFLGNLEQISGQSRHFIHSLERTDKVEFIPVAVMRGCSFVNTLLVVDEVQSFDRHELLTLVTRVGEGSKMILMGDPTQIDGRLAWEDTGLYRLIHNEATKNSPLTSYIELIKNCRSPLVELMWEVLAEEPTT